MNLSEEHINYIIKDISYRGIVYDELGDELVDHICTMVEERMNKGDRFICAYDNVLKQFGKEPEIQELQTQTITYTNNNTKIMLRNYFKIAFRNLTKHKFYTFINVSGLAVGIACCILITLFIKDEISYDGFHEKSDRIFRVTRHGMFNGNEFNFPVNPAPLGPTLVSELPEVENAVRFRGWGTFLVGTENSTESFKEAGIIYADNSVFDVFTIPVISGNPEIALVNKSTVAISRSAALKYFNSTDVVGQTLIMDGDEKFTVTLVFEDFPSNSHLQHDFFMSMENMEESKSQMWLSNNFFTYLVAKKGADPKVLEQKILELAEKKLDPQIQQFIGKTLEEFTAAGNYVDFRAQPLKDIYLKSSFTFDIGRTSDIIYVYLFGAVALFILVIACINFMNLSTARSSNRAKEVGVRKVLGSFRSHLIRQFLTETILLCFIAVLIAIVIASTALPFFNELAGKSMGIPFNEPVFYFVIIAVILFIGILAGIYPAFFLSSFKPINVLKGRLSLGAGNSFVRSGLVVFQFFISILLIVATITVFRQLSFIQNTKLGFDKEQVLMLKDTYMLNDKLDAFKEELKMIPGISSVTLSGYIPVNGYNRSDMSFWKEGEVPSDDNMVNMQQWRVDYDYIETLGMEIIKGRNFDENLTSDSSAMILNESAYKAYALKENEDMIQTFDYDFQKGQVIPNQFLKYRIIGVIKDFHFESMKQNIGPLGISIGSSRSIISSRINSADLSAVISQIEDKWKKFAPGLPFNYSFLDQDFDNMYRAENRLAKIFTIFAGLSIFIGCLGLFALAAFMAEQRTKEIGIRKVMGASVSGIVFLLSREFSRLIAFAFLISVPVAWFAMDSWLQNYNYRIEIGMMTFAIAGISAFLIALITVSYQSIKAATSNPVESLRNE